MSAPLERYAEWRRIDPSISASSLPSRPVPNRLGIERSEVLIFLVLVAASAFLHRAQAWKLAIMCVVAAGLAAYYFYSRRRTLRALTALAIDIDLRDETYLGLAHVNLTQGTLHLGSDMGAVHVDDSYLHFHGLRTEFSISANTYSSDLTLLVDRTSRVLFHSIPALPPGESIDEAVLHERIERAFQNPPKEEFAILPPAKQQPRDWVVVGLSVGAILFMVDADTIHIVVYFVGLCAALLWRGIKAPPPPPPKSRWPMEPPGSPPRTRD